MDNYRVVKIGAVLLITFSLFSACSLEYQEAIVEEKISESIPDTIIIDFQHIVVQEGKIIATLEAHRAETYGKKHEIILEGVRFFEHDARGQGEVVTEGEAEHAIFHSDTENAEISGSISFYSRTDGIRIVAENLTWTKDDKKLESGPGEFVRLEKDDGSFFEGRGFSADLKTKVIRFSSDVIGQYVQQD